MEHWYEIGVTLGLGLAAGVLVAGILGGLRFGFATSIFGAVGIGVIAGWLVKEEIGIGGGIVGGVIGAISTAIFVRAALATGGSVGATGVILVAAALVIALCSLIPVVGYVFAIVLPVMAYRRWRQLPERYAGLRTLAK